MLFRFADASLGKLGIRKMAEAERLVDKWFSQYLSGTLKPQAEEFLLNKTVSQVTEAFLERLAAKVKPKLSPTHRGDPTKHPTYQKYKSLLDGLIDFAKEISTPDRELKLMKQITTDDLFRLQESWKGRLLKDASGALVQQPKSDIGKDRDQGLLRKFFQWCRINRYIIFDPCEALELVGAPKSEVKPFTAEERKRIYEVIPVEFPRTFEYVNALILLLEKAAGRISAVATARTTELTDEGITLYEIKGRGARPKAVWCVLPPEAVSALRNLGPKSKEYFFWTGKSTLKTLLNHWEKETLRLYRAAGIENKRNHEWRDTMGEDLQEAGADLEHIQAALAHDRKTTTERCYVGKNKRKYSETDDYKKQMWGMNPVAATPIQTAQPPSSSLSRLMELERMLIAGRLTAAEFDFFKTDLMRPA